MSNVLNIMKDEELCSDAYHMDLFFYYVQDIIDLSMILAKEYFYLFSPCVYH